MKDNEMIVNDEKTIATVGEMNINKDFDEQTQSMYISFKPEDMEDKKLLYSATTGGTLLKEVLNKKIKMMDVVIMEGTVADKKSGAVNVVPRVSIITIEGETYVASSWGVYNCLKRIKAIFGTLHFEDGLAITPVQVATKNGFTMNLKLG